MSSSPARLAPSPRRLGGSGSPQPRLRGSRTITPESSATQTQTLNSPIPAGLVLRLRGEHSQNRSPAEQVATASDIEDSASRQRRRIQWAEGVIDNEGLGRKKSKVCCIFHKTREVGESSSEDDSSSSESGSGSGASDDGGARMVGGKRRRKGRGRGKGRHDHDHDHGDGRDCGHSGAGARKPSPNAYERQPVYNVKPLDQKTLK